MGNSSLPASKDGRRDWLKMLGLSALTLVLPVTATGTAIYMLRGKVQESRTEDEALLHGLRYGPKVREHELRSGGRVVLARFNSTAIDTVAWGYPEKCLMVRFQNKAPGAYLYKDVPLETVQGLLLADSAGRYFNAHIKGKYEYRRVPLEELR